MYTESLNAKRLSHYQVLGPDYVVTFIEKPEELHAISAPITLIGSGTNRLWVHQQNSTLLSFKRLDHICFEDHHLVRVGAGARLPTIISHAKDRDLTGLAFTWPINATLGGAMAQNFGAYGSHIGQCVRAMTLYNFSTKQILYIDPVNEADWFAYRHSQLKSDQLALLEAVLELYPAPKEDIQSELDTIQKQRTEKYALRHTCGSVFKNRPDYPAGKLMDECGLKGFRLGRVRTSEYHANIIIADPDSTTQDIYDLIQHLHQTVLSKRGISLELELSIY